MTELWSIAKHDKNIEKQLQKANIYMPVNARSQVLDKIPCNIIM